MKSYPFRSFGNSSTKDSEDCYRNMLMEHYRDLVRYAAERLHSKLPDKVELDDLISAGIFGLMDAIDAYDPERGVKFETYCAPRIKGSILDELRSMDWVPRLVRARAHQLSKATPCPGNASRSQTRPRMNWPKNSKWTWMSSPACSATPTPPAWCP